MTALQDDSNLMRKLLFLMRADGSEGAQRMKTGSGDLALQLARH